jgi:hypothetical protein
MSASRLVVLSLVVLHLSLATAIAAPISLYDGSSSPTSQGWSRQSNGGTETVGAGTSDFNTLTAVPEVVAGLYNMYTYATGATAYIVSIELQVLASSYNSFDAAITFSPFGDAADFPTNDRANSLTIGNGVLLWGDNAGGSVTLDTSVFHEYALRYQGGHLDVFVDASFDSIANGTAIALLTRTTGPTAGKNVGTIVFGDATNDVNVNSHYVVDFVNFQDLNAATTVPEPGTLASLAFGLATLGARRFRRTPEMK